MVSQPELDESLGYGMEYRVLRDLVLRGQCGERDGEQQAKDAPDAWVLRRCHMRNCPDSGVALKCAPGLARRALG